MHFSYSIKAVFNYFAANTFVLVVRLPDPGIGLLYIIYLVRTEYLRTRTVRMISSSPFQPRDETTSHCLPGPSLAVGPTGRPFLRLRWQNWISGKTALRLKLLCRVTGLSDLSKERAWVWQCRLLSRVRPRWQSAAVRPIARQYDTYSRTLRDVLGIKANRMRCSGPRVTCHHHYVSPV